jgi:hypothetical protein
VNKQRKNEPKQKPTKKADIDSIDSVICACGTAMFMRLLHENAKGLPELEALQPQGDDDSQKMDKQCSKLQDGSAKESHRAI